MFYKCYNYIKLRNLQLCLADNAHSASVTVSINAAVTSSNKLQDPKI